MLSSTQNQSNAGARKAAITALGGAMSAQTAHKAAAAAVSEQVSLQQSSRSFGPESLLAWMTGVLAAAACVAPWFKHGWLLFGLVVAIFTVLTFYDALALWLSREDGAPFLLLPERGLRGRVGQLIQIPIAITKSSNGSPLGELHVALMATTPESESAFRVENPTQILKLESSNSTGIATGAKNANATPHIMLWPWTP